MTRSQMIETVARKTGFTEAQVETRLENRKIVHRFGQPQADCG